MNGARLNEKMIAAALEVMQESGASALMLFIDAVEDWSVWRVIPDLKRLIMVTRDADTEKELVLRAQEFAAIVKLPDVNLTRLGQIKLAVIKGLYDGVIKNSDRVVCLTGLKGRGIVDTMMVLDLAQEDEVFTTRGISKEVLARVNPHVLELVLTLALELAGEGREGKSIGATFVIGDHEKVDRLSRPLIMNPFKGYPEEARNILDEAVHETIKEFALFDGAFIIREDGVVMAAGVHLDAALEREGHLPGLGCRHMAAAGTTDVTDAVAITISGSTGVVRIFKNGGVILELERPS